MPNLYRVVACHGLDAFQQVPIDHAGAVRTPTADHLIRLQGMHLDGSTRIYRSRQWCPVPALIRLPAHQAETMCIWLLIVAAPLLMCLTANGSYTLTHLQRG